MANGLGVRQWIAGLVAAGIVAPLLAAHAQTRHPFEDVAEVLLHPRCLNCHPSGNAPLQGGDSRPHQMKIVRGIDDPAKPGPGAGVTPCTACHRRDNSEVSIVPGAPHWSLAPLNMAWQGLSSAQLCAKLTNMNLNGGRDIAKLVKHMKTDPLVLWGWKPGGDRKPIPVLREEFELRLDRWAASGGTCP